MRIKKYITSITLHALFFICVFSLHLYALPARGAQRYTFHFNNSSISDVLGEISQKSGITIILKSDINKTVQGKSYTNQTLERIIADLMRGENCAVVWNYNKGILASIGLYTFEKDSKGVNMRFFPNITPPVREPEPEIARNIDVPPAAQETESARADEEREIEVRRALMMAREIEMMRGRDMESDNDLPGPGFPGINSPMRRVNGERDAIPGSADNQGVVNPPGAGGAADTGRGEEANAATPESPPDVPAEAATPPIPEVPDPSNFNGLEPPPMPPGF